MLILTSLVLVGLLSCEKEFKRDTLHFTIQNVDADHPPEESDDDVDGGSTGDQSGDPNHQAGVVCVAHRHWDLDWSEILRAFFKGQELTYHYMIGVSNV